MLFELTSGEKLFAKLLLKNIHNLRNVDADNAARIAFGWACDPRGVESYLARIFANDPRIVAEIERLQSREDAREDTEVRCPVSYDSLRKEFHKAAALGRSEFTYAGTRYSTDIEREAP